MGVPPIPSRDAICTAILRRMARSETPMRYVMVQKVRNFLYALSDIQYEGLIERLRAFDPHNVDPNAKAALIRDFERYDETGSLKAMAESVLKDPEFMGAAHQMITQFIEYDG